MSKPLLSVVKKYGDIKQGIHYLHYIETVLIIKEESLVQPLDNEIQESVERSEEDEIDRTSRAQSVRADYLRRCAVDRHSQRKRKRSSAAWAGAAG